MGMVLLSTSISFPDPSVVPDVVSFPSSPLQVEEDAEGTVPFSLGGVPGLSFLEELLRPLSV